GRGCVDWWADDRRVAREGRRSADRGRTQAVREGDGRSPRGYEPRDEGDLLLDPLQAGDEARDGGEGPSRGGAGDDDRGDERGAAGDAELTATAPGSAHRPWRARV